MIFFWFYFSGLSNRNMRKIYCHWRLESVYTNRFNYETDGGPSGTCFSLLYQSKIKRKTRVKSLIDFLIQSLRNHAYSNILKISSPKTENFQMKNSDIFPISAQNIDCGYSLEPSRRGGSNEYPQSMFLSRNKKNNIYPCKPQFYYIKVGFKGVKII